MNVLYFIWQLTVVAIIDIIFPIISLRNKFDAIAKATPTTEYPCIDTTKWSKYVEVVMSKQTDYFDKMFMTKIAKFNRSIKMAITESKVDALYFDDFQRIANTVYGDAASIRYRHTYNARFFASIFDDDGPHRRFKWCDKI